MDIDVKKVENHWCRAVQNQENANDDSVICSLGFYPFYTGSQIRSEPHPDWNPIGLNGHVMCLNQWDSNQNVSQM